MNDKNIYNLKTLKIEDTDSKSVLMFFENNITGGVQRYAALYRTPFIFQYEEDGLFNNILDLISSKNFSELFGTFKDCGLNSESIKLTMIFAQRKTTNPASPDLKYLDWYNEHVYTALIDQEIGIVEESYRNGRKIIDLDQIDGVSFLIGTDNIEEDNLIGSYERIPSCLIAFESILLRYIPELSCIIRDVLAYRYRIKGGIYFDNMQCYLDSMYVYYDIPKTECVNILNNICPHLDLEIDSVTEAGFIKNGFTFSPESMGGGTRKLCVILPLVFYGLTHGKLIILGDLSGNLHPLLEKAIVELFEKYNNKVANQDTLQYGTILASSNRL